MTRELFQFVISHIRAGMTIADVQAGTKQALRFQMSCTCQCLAPRVGGGVAGLPREFDLMSSPVGGGMVRNLT